MNILAISAIPKSVKEFNTGCKETLHFSPVTESVIDLTSNAVDL